MDERRTGLPRAGWAREDILEEMGRFRADDANYEDGRTWSLVYKDNDEHIALLKEAYGMFFSENGLNPMAFKSLKRFESEVVRMSAAMLNGDREVVGTMTSGGTESCMLAIKTYRDMARAKRPRLKKPEVIAPETVHVAFDKAAAYFGVTLVHAPRGKDGRLDLRAVKRRINRNTILLIGSAPNYPDGMIDPIAELGAMATKAGLPLHVDGCLGGFMLPFVEGLGYPIRPFDFRVPGVCSMSADLHKYGYAAKGASVILYRSMDIMKHQIFVTENWPGGIFASPALLGTRPGGAIAAAWASLMAIGQEGYLERAKRSMDTATRLMQGINAIEGLAVIGEPDMCVFAYRATDPAVNIFAVGDQMQARGWHIDRQQRPDALHAMVTPRHEAVAGDYLEDLQASVAEVRARPELATAGGAATYGMISATPLRGLIRKQVLKMMMDLYGPDETAIDLDEPGDDLATQAGLAYLKVRDALAKRGWLR